MTRTSPKEMLVDRLQRFGFPPPCYLATGLLTLAPVRLIPSLNAPAFREQPAHAGCSLVLDIRVGCQAEPGFESANRVSGIPHREAIRRQ